jgi:tripartite-type tricarboxylate transporter receptor subunit TctC
MKQILTTLLAAVWLVLGTSATTALAQTYPTKPIKLIVPFPPGGGTDIIARTIAQKLTDTQKWTVVVENKPGAGGNLGVDAAAKSAPDGYTLVLGQTSNLAINPSLYSKLPYDPVKDLALITLVAQAPVVLVARADSSLKTLADVIAASKAKQGQLSVGSPGNGTVAHLSIEMMQKQGNFKLLHVPYRGSPQAITDLMGGSIELYIASVPTALGHIKNGKLRAIAVTSPQRSPALPDVPTVAEAGIKGYDAITWFGIAASTGTPAAVLKTLSTEINRALAFADVRTKLQSEGGDAMGGTPEQFAALLKSDLARWGQLVRESGAKID